MTARLCKHCGEPIPDESNSHTKYCSVRCRIRYNSLKQYYKMKDDPGYKRMRKEYFKKWLAKNRGHFNEIMRPFSREYQRKKQLRKKEMDKLHDAELRNKMLEEANVV